MGKNEFSGARNIIQVGINRYPDSVYLMYYLAFHPELRDELTGYEKSRFYRPYTVDGDNQHAPQEEGTDPKEGSPERIYDRSAAYRTMMAQTERIRRMMTDLGGEYSTIMYSIELAELEQNLFRGCIRQSDNQEDYTFHLFLDVKQHLRLISMIRDRYEPLGATVTVVNQLPSAVAGVRIMQRKGYAGKKTLLQSIIDWHDHSLKSGETYTPSDIRKACGIENIKVYEQLRRRSKFLRERMGEEKTRHGVYTKESDWISK